ncbi:MAG: hypothetical protein DRQ55_16135 [Planctomycetota bacterium]|nr:MAG: hypothetical protein DRQ55_16135 [Planctomycetota bacterium]
MPIYDDNPDMMAEQEQDRLAIETDERLAIFVYGTLRPGHGNSRLWQGLATARYDGKCFVLGYRLVGGGFPYAIPAPTAQTVGTLVYPHPEHEDEVRQQMDWLEGYPSHYTRVVTAVVTPDGYRLAWIYTPPEGKPFGLQREVRTDSNGRFDWNMGTKARRDEQYVRAGWWDDEQHDDNF